MNYKHFKTFFERNASKKILYGVLVFFVALIIFQAGVSVGYHKASFSYGAGDNFHRIYGQSERYGMMGRGGMMGGFPGNEFTSGYGTTGVIVKIALPQIMVAGVDKVEKIITVDEKTLVRLFRDDIKATDLRVGDTIIVVGAPNSASQIEAKLIRVLPPPMMQGIPFSTATSTR